MDSLMLQVLQNECLMQYFILSIEDKRHEIIASLAEVKASVVHILQHLEVEAKILPYDLTEIHKHLDILDQQLQGLHVQFESAASKWRRSRPFPETHLGEQIPIKLFLPVTIDAAVDGFLIGITCSISFRAGLILGFANCLEMGFLGMSFSARVVKCTGSTKFVRLVTVIVPPVVMLVASGVGAAVGLSVKSVPVLFISFVSFGIVALLYLACNELIVEAHAASDSSNRWWVSSLIFVGVYCVFVMSLLID